MHNNSLPENINFVENLLEKPSFDKERKNNFKITLYNYITALKSDNSNKNFITALYSFLFQSRFILIGAFSFIIILAGIAVLPNLIPSQINNTSNSNQSSQASENDISASEREVEMRLSKLDNQINNITLDNDSQLLNEQDIVLQ